jgi:hypothetical protein
MTAKMHDNGRVAAVLGWITTAIMVGAAAVSRVVG